MNLQKLSAAASFVLLMLNVSPVLASPAEGVISFKGRVFGAACDPSNTAGAVMTLKSCPAISRSNIINVRSVGSGNGLEQAAPKATLLHDSGAGGNYYDQHYLLVNQAGEPLRSGAYLVTFISQ